MANRRERLFARLPTLRQKDAALLDFLKLKQESVEEITKGLEDIASVLDSVGKALAISDLMIAFRLVIAIIAMKETDFYANRQYSRLKKQFERVA